MKNQRCLPYMHGLILLRLKVWPTEMGFHSSNHLTDRHPAIQLASLWSPLPPLPPARAIQ